MNDEAVIEDLRWFSEALLMQKLGYTLLCARGGQTYPVDDIRAGNTSPNLEVLTIQGWERPEKCWAVLRPEPQDLPPPNQPSLF
jgi:hypothetical protein